MFNKTKAGAIGAFATMGAYLGLMAHTAKAADPAFEAALASSTGIVGDNLGSIFNYILNVWGKGFLIGLLLAVLSLTAAIVIGSIFRRKKKGK